MINTINWTPWFKIYDGIPQPTNLLYTPLVNEDKNIMCMLFDETSPYQQENTRLNKELVDFFFQQEVEHIQLFQGYDWAPQLLDIEYENRKIFIEWNRETLNTIIFTPGRSLDEECPDWREQIFTILSNIVGAGYLKMALYPHCFFIDKIGKIKTFDFYGCLHYDKRFLELKKIEGMIGNESTQRFADATTDGIIDFEKFFKFTVQHHLAKAWPDNPFPEYYRRLYGD